MTHAAASTHDTYVSPLAERNASPRMLRVWSARHKFSTWRRIWLALAEAEHALGLPVTEAQIAQIRAHLDVDEEDLARAAEHERRLRHDVMAHVHALGDVAPEARPVIHLGMTSQDVVCNADALILRDALRLTAAKLAHAIDALASFAGAHRSLPTLGFTHYQPAQPTTVGKRAANWAYDLLLCLERIERTIESLRPRGLKGATGTQASFLALLDNDPARVDALERDFLDRIGFAGAEPHDLTGQTYPRVADAMVLSDLAAAAAALHKAATDIRLLCNRKEIDEPFGSSQIGSSAMPYKRNPMRCERICGLARFVMALPQNALDTAATQWLERTLDDSSNRRLSLPEAFLALDGCLDLMHNVASGLEVHEATVRANLMAELPFMATENILMAAVRAGGDRQEVHEAIRRHAQAAGLAVKKEGRPNDLLERLSAEPLLRGVDVRGMMDPAAYVGRAPEQVDRFLAGPITALRSRYAADVRSLGATEPKV